MSLDYSTSIAIHPIQLAFNVERRLVLIEWRSFPSLDSRGLTEIAREWKTNEWFQIESHHQLNVFGFIYFLVLIGFSTRITANERKRWHSPLRQPDGGLTFLRRSETENEKKYQNGCQSVVFGLTFAFHFICWQTYWPSRPSRHWNNSTETSTKRFASGILCRLQVKAQQTEINSTKLCGAVWFVQCMWAFRNARLTFRDKQSIVRRHI